MKLLGFYFSFISVLIITYTLFLRYFHLDPDLLILGGIIGFAHLAAGYLLMLEKRSGILFGTFVSAITLGFSAYFLGEHYFSSTMIPALPDIIMSALSLLAFLLCLSLPSYKHAQPEE